MKSHRELTRHCRKLLRHFLDEAQFSPLIARQPNVRVVLMLPPFDTRGNLPPGVHHATWEEVVERFGCSQRRKWLLNGLRRAALDLSHAGCKTIYIDGSFVTSKDDPGDYDACYELDGVDLNSLLKTAPVFFDFKNSRAAQKAKYRGEWFPAEMSEGSTRKRFVEFFQKSKDDGEAKGIIAVDIRSLS